MQEKAGLLADDIPTILKWLTSKQVYGPEGYSRCSLRLVSPYGRENLHSESVLERTCSMMLQ